MMFIVLWIVIVQLIIVACMLMFSVGVLVVEYIVTNGECCFLVFLALKPLSVLMFHNDSWWLYKSVEQGMVNGEE